MQKHSTPSKKRKTPIQRRRKPGRVKPKSHSKRKPKPKRKRKPKASHHRSEEPSGFLGAWQTLTGIILWPVVPRRRGRKPRVDLPSLLAALVFHVMNPVGTLGEHFSTLFEDALCDSACSDRRARLPWQVFADVMQRVLRPLAKKRRHPEAYWRGWRLIALDGTQHSVTNTPQNNRALRKARARRGRAAFAKITTSVLLELGLHNPLAAAIGHKGQSEWELSLSLLARLPKEALLLADRLSGCAAFAAQALQACQRVGSQFLFRARTQIKVKVVRRLKDGSRLVRLPVRQKGKPRQIVQWLELREIRVQLHRKGHRSTDLRLWTTLLDPKTAPAKELIALYAQRWEHELFYRELKRQLRKSGLLQSHTVTTAAQEIAALILAAALLAQERDRAAAGQVPVLRVSFVKLLEHLKPLWLVLALGDDLLSEEQKQQLTERFYQKAGSFLTPKRRRRSCPRKVRQPVSGWPRLLNNEYGDASITFKMV
jgi:Transposase DDE domain